MRKTTNRYRPAKERKDLQFQDGVTAHGTETRPQKGSKSPFFLWDNTLKSETARWYAGMRLGQKHGTASLIKHMSSNIAKMAKFEGIAISRSKSHVWASIIIKKHIGTVITDRLAAELLGLSCHREYQRKHKTKELQALDWLAKYSKESGIKYKL